VSLKVPFRSTVSSLSLLASAAVLVLGGVGCGSSSKSSSSGADATVATTAAARTTEKPFTPPPNPHHYKGDEDDDDTRAGVVRGSAPPDNDADFDNDAKDRSHESYRDSDDAIVVAYSVSAQGAEKRAVTAVVNRFFGAVAKGAGKAGCAVMYSILEEAVPEDYGRDAGPAYARGNTCPAVMSKVFRHERGQAHAHFTVTDVRVEGNRAIALLGSHTQPASFINLHRENGVWKIARPLAAAVP
jgi:hypothetical protein